MSQFFSINSVQIRKTDAFMWPARGERQMPAHGPHCCGISGTKSVSLKATAAICTGCVRHGVGHQPKTYDSTYSS